MPTYVEIKEFQNKIIDTMNIQAIQKLKMKLEYLNKTRTKLVNYLQNQEDIQLAYFLLTGNDDSVKRDIEKYKKMVVLLTQKIDGINEKIYNLECQ